jgi:predicted transcriptional regulator
MEQKVESKAEAQKERPSEKKEQVIIFKDKQARILLSLRASEQELYISSLAKMTNTTYVHACKFLKECEAAGITVGERHGKIKVIKLTDKGKKIAEMIDSIYGLISNQKKPEQKQTE